MKQEKQRAGFHLLVHSVHLLDDRLRELLAPLGIHAGQARIIHGIHRMGEASQRQLADQFNVTPASMSQMTKRLINNGFIKVRPDPSDKRSSLVSLTSEGEMLLNQIIEVWKKVDDIIIDAIGARNAEQLFSQSLKLRDTLGGKAPGTKDVPR
ncbi:hypothetical protein A3753_12480 [Sulfitobacter sp. HI0082]|jgi:DNA-binding MarR family transcriptional regulator|uniref:MarR family winged helix-turn-helix transcriptional regulator n=2 Tax=Pseudomonadota TaxID=1224 RepID=UPI0007C36D28|nr:MULTISPECIES: MarR family winged helix-turn-helix transcriptional regulator [unclassified Sulfitobacter]KZZ21932.1 hypothetical protein A3753_21875 [Sulfitobacter sp. HI0082]KZX98233.1 hypothetical protein A3720_16240 [Sulfitobacter sp. HI0021]KZY00328.1 hypothetical protein A3722_11015 [Sulfitobacter sp. HI0027]KZY98921.1 hypothetical protein A3747_22935 [Sulfitobacter sp. HI0076]KZZ28454.1 hypothetical protein A3753_12480 [Sulfitobacter sp. HI0082]|tara:strand:+ start:123 stop:581 length:459 start_codon:yes stop_codon:yes gene_type:complete